MAANEWTFFSPVPCQAWHPRKASRKVRAYFLNSFCCSVGIAHFLRQLKTIEAPCRQFGDFVSLSCFSLLLTPVGLLQKFCPDWDALTACWQMSKLPVSMAPDWDNCMLQCPPNILGKDLSRNIDTHSLPLSGMFGDM